MTTDTLLPCPFCGNDVQDDEGCFPAGRGNTHFIVRCGNPGCNAEVSMPSKADTIAAWNRRASPSAAEVQALVERLWTLANESEAAGAGRIDAEAREWFAGRAEAYEHVAELLAKLIPRNPE